MPPATRPAIRPATSADVKKEKLEKNLTELEKHLAAVLSPKEVCNNILQ